MQLLNRIYHQYGPRLVLEDVSLTAEPGQIVGLMGPSGCGKTTLLNLLAGLQLPSAGTVVGDPTHTAYVFQEPRLLPWYTAVDNIALGLEAQDMALGPRRQVAHTLAAAMGLADATDLYPAQLSGGMQQRVNLARAFAVHPRLLLLDEPFNALDMGTRRQLQRLVMAWVQRQQAMAVLVTHDLAEAVTVADDLLVLSARPARIVYRWHNPQPAGNRDPAYVYRTLSHLQTIPALIANFDLDHPFPSPQKV